MVLTSFPLWPISSVPLLTPAAQHRARPLCPHPTSSSHPGPCSAPQREEPARGPHPGALLSGLTPGPHHRATAPCGLATTLGLHTCAPWAWAPESSHTAVRSPRDDGSKVAEGLSQKATSRCTEPA